MCSLLFRLPTQLNEIAIGVVVGRIGQKFTLSKPHGNVFVYEKDRDGQTLLSLFKDISYYSLYLSW